MTTCEFGCSGWRLNPTSETCDGCWAVLHRLRVESEQSVEKSMDRSRNDSCSDRFSKELMLQGSNRTNLVRNKDKDKRHIKIWKKAMSHELAH